MNLLKYLELNDAQKQINTLSNKYKNKKIAIYGAGEYFQLIEKHYDLSKLDIVAISDLKFATDKTKNQTKFLPIAPNDLKEYDFDVLLIALIHDLPILKDIDNKILKGSKNEKKPILPLISPTFSYIFKLFFNKV